MQVKSGQAVVTGFGTQAPTTGAATNADSLPTGILYVDGVADAAVVTVTNVATGRYKAAVTLPALTAGQMTWIWISATVGGVAGGGKVWEASADTRYVSDSVAQTGDSYARIGSNGAGLTAVGDTSGTTTLLSRLSSARAGYLDNLSAGAVALASALTSAQADLTTLLSRITGAVSLATATTAAAIRSALGMAAADLDTQLDALGSATDPMTNAASGYASGTLGYIISRLTSARVTVSSFLSEAGDMAEIVAGADYNATDGTAFDWTQDTGAWPTLTDATVVWHGRSPGGASQTYSITVTDATGATKAVRLELTAAQSQALADVAVGVWRFAIWATLSSGRKVRLVQGSAPVTDGPGPS